MTTLMNERETCICGSICFIRNRDGFLVCESCGNVIKLSNLKNSANPSDFTIYKTHKYSSIKSVFKPTMGTGKEKRKHKMRDVFRLEKINQTYNYTDVSIKTAFIEISKIGSALGFNKKMNDYIFYIFKKIYPKIEKGKETRNPERLIPTIIYIITKNDNKGISLSQIAEKSFLTKNEIFKYAQQLQDIFKIEHKNMYTLITSHINDLCKKMNVSEKIERDAIDLIKQSPKNTSSRVIGIGLLYIAMKNNGIIIFPSNIVEVSNKIDVSATYRFIKRFFGYPDNYRFKDLVEEKWDWNKSDLLEKYQKQKKMWLK